MKIEPRSDVRTYAAELWQFYVAFTNAGFMPDQAMELIAQMMMSSAAHHCDGED